MALSLLHVKNGGPTTTTTILFENLIADYYHHITTTTTRHKNTTPTTATHQHQQVYTTQGNAPIYKRIEVEGDNKVGQGSTGIVFRGKYYTPLRAGKQQRRGGGGRILCAIKFPNTLFEKKEDKQGIQIKNGAIHITTTTRPNHPSSTTPTDLLLYKEALSDLETEWKNGFILHFGKEMWDTKVAQQAQIQISMHTLEKPILRYEALKLEWGYTHIHELFARDVQTPCIISESFDTSLLDWARHAQQQQQEGPWAPEQIILGHIMPQIVAGIQYMHYVVGMAHMDIKPTNMLCKTEKLHCVLCDFGGCLDANTLSKEYSGTVGYMAPEIQRFGSNLLISTVDAPGYIPKHADAFSYAASMLHILHPEIPCGTDDDQRQMLAKLIMAAEKDHNNNNNQFLLSLLADTTPTADRYAKFQQHIEYFRSLPLLPENTTRASYKKKP